MSVVHHRHVAHTTRPAASAQAIPAGAPMAVALFNDAGDRPDVGSLAVSQAIRRLLRQAGAVVRHASYRGDWTALAAGAGEPVAARAEDSAELQRVFAEVDAVVVDGGRSLGRSSGRHLLAILGAAQRGGLPTFLVNASIDVPLDDDALAVLAALTDCTTPDARTSRWLTGCGIAHRLVPDAIFAADFLETPIHDLREHLVLLDLDAAHASQPELLALRAAWPGPLREYGSGDRARALDWRHTVANLRAAAVVVCGSHHAACLAMAAGAPFVRLDAGELPSLGDAAHADGVPAETTDTALPLEARVDAARRHAGWFRDTAAVCAGLLPLDTFWRLLPGLAPYSTAVGVSPSVTEALDAVRRTTPIGGTVLHAGAGDGQLVDALTESGFRAWGTDAAWRLAHPDRHRYSTGTPWALPFADHVFSAVVISAGWLDHLELDDLDLALTELARVARDTVVLEVSGRALRARRAVDGERRATWWEERLDLHGFRAPHGATPIATGPHSLLVMQAATPLCPGCGRSHGTAAGRAAVHAPMPMPGVAVVPRAAGLR